MGDEVIKTEVDLPDDGAAITVGLRPQHLEVVPAQSPVIIDLRERLGGVAYDYLTTPTGERIVVETRGDEPISSGTSVDVIFDATSALFFDAETDARIR